MGAPKRKQATVTPLRAQQTAKRRRLVVDIDSELYDALQDLADDSRRELKAQVLVVLEAAVKAHAGRKTAAARRKAWNRVVYGDGE